VLKQLQLQTKLARIETDISPVDLNDGRAPDIRSNKLLATTDLLLAYCIGHAGHEIPGYFRASP
jgi:hypothetical protein